MNMTMHKPKILSTFGCSTEIGDLEKSTCIFIDGLWLEDPEFKSAECKIFVQGTEPPEIWAEAYTIDGLLKVADQFDLILYCDERLAHLPNSKPFPFGCCWISEDFENYEKRFELSHIIGWKQFMPGHKLRHIVWSRCNNINKIPMKIYPRPDPEGQWEQYGKDKCFDTSQFAVVIENSRHKNYFTEKIVDCLFTKTIPLYWGCPNIGDYFNTSGIITFTDIDDLIRKANSLTPELYATKLEVIEENRNLCLEYFNLNKRIGDEARQLWKK